ncbi:MAG: hypothetical protein Q7K16_01725 [Candidatus Azambacteria bacterium]|nr:hypothetical protein [Candidatus Azambacteria bacterium]
MSIKNMELGPMGDEHIDAISKNAGAENMDVQKDIRDRAQGNPGAANILGQLAARGAEIYSKVAPNLGTSSEIWEKYKDECGQDLDAMIEKYGK